MDAQKARPRKRYIGFRLERDGGTVVQRAAMVEALDGATREVGLPDRRRLTVFTGDTGIVRCDQSEREAMMGALASIEEVDGRPARVVTLVTSGTIKKVKRHLGLDRDV